MENNIPDVNVPEESWKSLEEKGEGSVYQRHAWIKAKKESGEIPYVISVNEGESLQGLLFVFERTLHLPALGKKKILFAEGNPLFKNDESLKALLNKFQEVSSKYYYGTIMPTVVKPLPAYDVLGFKKVTNYTAVVDLQKTEEELWSGLEKKSARWGVKTAEKNGVTFAPPENADEISEFYKLYAHTAHEGGFEAEKEKFVVSLANTDISRLFILKHEGKIIGGGLILLDTKNSYSILNLTSVSEEGKNLQAMPFLYWNLIKYSKIQGLQKFDLGGYDREAKETEKTHHINKFKERFGGEIVEQPIYATNGKYPFLRRVLKEFRFLKGTYKKEK